MFLSSSVGSKFELNRFRISEEDSGGISEVQSAPFLHKHQDQLCLRSPGNLIYKLKRGFLISWKSPAVLILWTTEDPWTTCPFSWFGQMIQWKDRKRSLSLLRRGGGNQSKKLMLKPNSIFIKRLMYKKAKLLAVWIYVVTRIQIFLQMDHKVSLGCNSFAIPFLLLLFCFPVPTETSARKLATSK